MFKSLLGNEIPDPKIYNESYGTLTELHIFKVVHGHRFQNLLRMGVKI